MFFFFFFFWQISALWRRSPPPKKRDPVHNDKCGGAKDFCCGKNVPKSPDFEEKNSEIALFIRDNCGGCWAPAGRQMIF
jgi:hypothetical protein